MEALTYAEAKQRFERNYLVQLLKLTDGNVADAAHIADRNRTEFYRLLQKYDLTPSLFRGNGDDPKLNQQLASRVLRSPFARPTRAGFCVRGTLPGL